MKDFIFKLSIDCIFLCFTFVPLIFSFIKVFSETDSWLVVREDLLYMADFVKLLKSWNSR